MVLAARDVREPWPAPCSETPHPTGCSRLGTAEVDSRALVSLRSEGGNRPQRLGGAGTRDRMDFTGCVAQLGEQPPCKRQVAGSNPATSTMFASLTQRQSAGLSSRKPRVRIPHEAPDHLAEIAQEVDRRVEGACVGGPKPSLGTRQNLVSSVGFRAPVYETGGRTFESCTRCHSWVCGREVDCGCL
jgi:hypothetical protein